MTMRKWKEGRPFYTAMEGIEAIVNGDIVWDREKGRAQNGHFLQGWPVGEVMACLFRRRFVKAIRIGDLSKHLT